MRHRVMLLADADLRIRSLAELSIAHEREYARQVGLIRERQQVVHEREVLFEHVGHAGGKGDGCHFDAVARFRALDAAFDFPHIVQIVAEPRAIARAERLLQIARLRRDQIQDAQTALHAGGALGLTPRTSEQPLEHGARVDLHRLRCGRRAPRDRVRVGAAVAARAGADVSGEVRGREFERRKRRVLPNLLRDDLIDRRAAAHVLGLRPLGQHTAQPARRADGVVALDDAGMGARQVADDNERLLERVERLENRREIEAQPGRLRRPFVDDGAVGHEDGAEAPRRHGGRRFECRHHRFENRQRDGRAEAAKKRASGERELTDEHLVSPAFQKACCRRCRGRSTRSDSWSARTRGRCGVRRACRDR